MITAALKVNFNGPNPSYNNTPNYNTVTSAQATLTGTLIANLLNTDGTPSGIALETITPFGSSIAHSTYATADHHGEPVNTWRGAWYTPNNGSSSFRLRGGSVRTGDTYVLRIQAFSANSARPSDITVDGITQRYANGGIDAPPAFLEFTGTVANNEIVVSVTRSATGGLNYGYMGSLLLEVDSALPPLAITPPENSEIGQYQEHTLSVAGFIEPITSGTFAGIPLPSVTDHGNGTVTIRGPGSGPASGTLVLSGANQTALLENIGLVITHPIPAPAFPVHDNSVWSGQGFLPTDEPVYWTASALPAGWRFAGAAASWADVDSADDIANYLLAMIDSSGPIVVNFSRLYANGTTQTWQVTVTPSMVLQTEWTNPGTRTTAPVAITLNMAYQPLTGAQGSVQFSIERDADMAEITLTDAQEAFGDVGPNIVYRQNLSHAEPEALVPFRTQFGRARITAGNNGRPWVRNVPGLPYGKGIEITAIGAEQNNTDKRDISCIDTEYSDECFLHYVSYWPAAHQDNAVPFLDGTCTWQTKDIWVMRDGDGHGGSKIDYFLKTPNWYNPNPSWTGTSGIASNSTTNLPSFEGDIRDGTQRWRATPIINQLWARHNPVGGDPMGGRGRVRHVDTEQGLICDADCADIVAWRGTTPTVPGIDRIVIPGFVRGFLKQYQCEKYFADVYFATGPGAQARVELTDTADHAAAKRIAVADVLAWSRGEVRARIRKGLFWDRSLVGLHVHLTTAEGQRFYCGVIE